MFYFFTQTKAEREQWSDAMIEMMRAIEGPRGAQAPTPSNLNAENLPPAAFTPTSKGTLTKSHIRQQQQQHA